METLQAASIAIPVLTLVLGALAYFKFRPGQRETLEVSIAQGFIDIAQGTVHLTTSTLEAQVTRMDAETRALRDDLNALNDKLDAVTRDLRGTQRMLALVTDERDALHEENRDLRAGVADLEGRLRVMEGGAK